ncbi:MltB: lytic murein transglycosylase B [Lysobacter silvestris]|uniref:MltB: lytic murein transglycosylase B n=2 Tax=Solilutibacter silvestris TaxID=1645665 RepID=A0A2K1Q036_9GAMM|nr:MltB: lytic murein transglycosylase B [Lysobacter silvestris]
MATPARPTGPVPDLVTARHDFARDAAAKYGVDPQRVESILASAQIRAPIIAAMSRPAEGKAWSEYRPLFLNGARIDGGKAFIAKHRNELQAVETKYGVPAEIIVAIIGVETGYGANMGKYPVVDALYTLGFRYPRTNAPDKIERENMREAFFRDELAQAFAMEKEARLDISQLRGSYAGAMGWGQFMPSSYRQYAVDGDGDGKRDLFGDLADVLPSIANYFVGRGQWQRGQPVMVRATRDAGAQAINPDNRSEAMLPQADLAKMGYRPLQQVAAELPANIITLDGANGPEYWMVFPNFVAITKYNKSPLYSTAVYQLSQMIAGHPVPGA